MSFDKELEKDADLTSRLDSGFGFIKMLRNLHLNLHKGQKTQKK